MENLSPEFFTKLKKFVDAAVELAHAKKSGNDPSCKCVYCHNAPIVLSLAHELWSIADKMEKR